MKYQLSIWDEKCLIQQGIISDVFDLKLDRELNGNDILTFSVSNYLASYHLFKHRKIIRLHDLTKPNFATTVASAGTNAITVASASGFNFDDEILIANKLDTDVALTCTDYFAMCKTWRSGDVYVDETTAAANDTRDDMNILGTAAGDTYYIGDTLQFNVCAINVTRRAIGVYKLVWEYYNGSAWVGIDIDYNTFDDFKEEGLNYIAFETPTDWSQVTVDSDTYYWIRVRLDSVTSITQAALGTRAYLGYYGNACKIQVNALTGVSAGDYVRLSSDQGDESIYVDSTAAYPLDYLVADVGYIHLRNGRILSPGASYIAKITYINNTILGLSRMDITPAVGAKVELVNFTTYRITEIEETESGTLITCSHISYDLNDNYFTYFGKFEASFNPDKTGPLVSDKIDIDAFMDYGLEKHVDADGAPSTMKSFIKGRYYGIKYKEGRITVVNGNATITGLATYWQDKRIAAGSTIFIEGDSTAYSIAYITSNTSLTLTANIARASASNLKYIIYSQTTYTGSIYNTGTLTVVRNYDEIVVAGGGNFSSITTGAVVRVENDDTTYYVSQVKSTTILSLTKPIERSSGASLNYFIDLDKRELSFSQATFRKALIDLVEAFSDDEWVTWFKVNEDKSIDIVRRPVPYSGVDPSSDLMVRAGKNLQAIKRRFSSEDFGTSIIPLGSESGWENAFSGITGTVITDSRNSNEVIKLTAGHAKKFRAADFIEILRGAISVTVSSSTPTIVTIAPQQADFQDDNGAFTDFTAAATDESTLNDVDLLPAIPAVDDAFYFGANYQFNRISMQLTTPGVGVWDIVWEYYDGATWSSLTFDSSEIDDFTETTATYLTNTFAPPTNWATVAVNGTTRYWVRARVSNYTSITTQPKASACFHGILKSNYYAGGRAVVSTGTGIGQLRSIISNTATTFTISRKWDEIPYAATIVLASKYTTGLEVRGFGWKQETVTGGHRLRRIECTTFNDPKTTGTAIAGSGATSMVDADGRNMSNLCAIGDYIYNPDDENNSTMLSAWAVITGFSTTNSANDTINFAGGLSEGQANTFAIGERFVVIDDAITIRGKYRGGIISFIKGAAIGSAYELWGNDDVSFITKNQMTSALPSKGDHFQVVAPSQLVEQFDYSNPSGTVYPDYNDGGVGARFVILSNDSNYFQSNVYHHGRLYISSGIETGDSYEIDNGTLGNDGNSVYVTSWTGGIPTDGDTCMIIKETDLPLSVIKHELTPLAGDSVILLLYENGPLTFGKYASYRTYIASGNVKLSKTVITVNDASIFSKGQVIFIGAHAITSTMIFGMERGNQALGVLRTIKSISGNEITLREPLTTVPQPGDQIEAISIVVPTTKRKHDEIELLYKVDITDPRQLHFHGQRYAKKMKDAPSPIYSIDFLSLYNINASLWKNDKYELGDTIILKDEEFGYASKQLRINHETIQLGQDAEVVVEVSNPAIMLKKLFHEDFTILEARTDDLEKLLKFNERKETRSKCIYFHDGVCRRNFAPNSFCNTMESNRDGCFTSAGNPIRPIHCQAYTPLFGYDPSIILASADKYNAGGPDTFTVPVNPGEDDSAWHDLTTYDVAEGVDFMITKVHLNSYFYLTSAPSYTLPLQAAVIEVRVKTTPSATAIDNGHGYIQGDTDGTGFVVEYRCVSGVAGIVTLEYWCWGYRK